MKKSFDSFVFDLFVKKKKETIIEKKDDFSLNIRNILNNIDIIFKNNDIQYEIPFVYKSNNDFSSLKIIVCDLYTPQQICDLLDIDSFICNREFFDIL